MFSKPEHGYYNTAMLAELVGVSDETIRQWAAKGIAPAHHRLPDNALRFHVSDIDTWLRGRNMPTLYQLERKQRTGI